MNIVRRVVASGDVPLLVLGETRVGKERLAEAIHAERPRSKGPFITVNCGALPESLLESELFGHEEGRFHRGHRSRRGWFELAHAGPSFWMKSASCRPYVQVKLLRVLAGARDSAGRERAEILEVDVRVMAATNRELAEDVEAQQVSPDLFIVSASSR